VFGIAPQTNRPRQGTTQRKQRLTQFRPFYSFFKFVPRSKMKHVRLRKTIIPAKGDLASMSMLCSMPEVLPDPAWRVFYSCILGYRNPPNRLSSLILKSFFVGAKVERWLCTRFPRWDRSFCTLGRRLHKFSFAAFSTSLFLRLIPHDNNSPSSQTPVSSPAAIAGVTRK